jgi:chemosensory pili system protein ChpA (sensor histidine kinase/response regulator)
MLTLETLAVLALLIALMICAMVRTKFQRNNPCRHADARRGARILIVDDDHDFVGITRRILESSGPHVITVSSGADALKVLYRARYSAPDLVLLEIMMDYVTSGLDVRRMMQRHPRLRDMPVMMVTSLTGMRRKEMLPSGGHARASEWLTKPEAAQQLLNTVRAALAASPAHIPELVPVAS